MNPFLRLLRPLLAALVAAASFGLTGHAAPAIKSDKPNFVYRLTITDRIRVAVFQEDDLAVIARIDARGNVNLKLVGDLPVAGLTVNDAQRAIEKAYREGRYLRSPQVTVTIEDYAPREVSIQGQVKAPGRYLLPIEATFSIIELVTKAGGLTDIARGNDVIVTRVLADGTKTTFHVDVDSVIRGKKTGQDATPPLELQAGDIVFVPERVI